MKEVCSTVRVIVETPKGSHQKFDYDPNLKLFVLSKLLPAGMVFPFDFGMLPETVGEDGDPLDILIISELATFTGCVVDCRIIGVITAIQIERNQEELRNDRFIAVPNISMQYKEVYTIQDLSTELLKEIEHFFINYNELAGKSFKILTHLGADEAMKLIEKGKTNS